MSKKDEIRRAKIFIKLDWRSEYNLIHIPLLSTAGIYHTFWAHWCSFCVPHVCKRGSQSFNPVVIVYRYDILISCWNMSTMCSRNSWRIICSCHTFWGQSLNSDVEQFVQACTNCSSSCASWQLPSGLLQHLPIPRQPWSHFALDFITNLTVSQGDPTVLTIFDHFSKACQLTLLLKLLSTALETTQVIYNEIFRHSCLPEDIASDQGSPKKHIRLTTNQCQSVLRVPLPIWWLSDQEIWWFLRTNCSN